MRSKLKTSSQSTPLTAASSKFYRTRDETTGRGFSNCLETLTFSLADSHVRTYQWLAPALAWLEGGAASGLPSAELLRCFDHLLLSLKMSPACCPAKKDGTSTPCSTAWRGSGMAWRGGRLTVNTSAWPSDASVCSLSEVLEPCVSPKYFLSPKACAGILLRAEKRGKELPHALGAALRAVATSQETKSSAPSAPGPMAEVDSEPTLSLGGGLSAHSPADRWGGRYDKQPLTISTLNSSMSKDKNGQDTGGAPPAIAFQTRIARNGRGNMGDKVNALQAQSGRTGKGDAAPCVAQPTGVRRLTPTECERLQGFPDGWTVGFSDSARYRMLGNAVSVPVAEWIGRRIVKTLK